MNSVFRLSLLIVLVVFASACDKFERGPKAGNPTPTNNPTSDPNTNPGVVTLRSSNAIAVVGLQGRKAEKITSGSKHSCVAFQDKGVSCWGENTSNQLGHASDAKTPHLPVSIDAFKDTKVDVLAAGRAHTCAANAHGLIYCWGSNTNGAVGSDLTDTSKPTATPQPVHLNLADPYDGIKKLTSFGDRVCALLDYTNYRQSWCWGAHDKTISFVKNKKELATAAAPEQISWGENSDVVSLSVSKDEDCAVVKDPKTAETSIECKANSWIDNMTPKTDGLNPFVKIETGKDHGCVITQEVGVRKLFCWGDNDSNQVNPAVKEATVPALTLVSLPQPVQKLALGTKHTCAIASLDYATPGPVYCWGNNSRGQCGATPSDKVIQITTVKLPANRTAREISAGDTHSCAILDDFTTFCWGDNAVGQLGNPIAPNAIPDET
jgi:alpha-tubulin suppressor-like RCC1 family protein